MRAARHAATLFLCSIASCVAAESIHTNSDAVPLDRPGFNGKIGKTLRTSEPAYTSPVAPPEGAPNVVVVLLDDVGFGHSSAFGGPIATPALDRLASQGLRYNNFHTTGMCSPTRAALLTGRNHHRSGNGPVPEGAAGFPGYDGHWTADTASLAQILRIHGYNTSMFGKWHNTPEWETGPAGPFERWPTGKGFEYFYGFLGGDTNQWAPALYENTIPIEFPARDGYTLNEALADKAIRWLEEQSTVAPRKPFFIYFAPGATHAPLQAPKEWIDRFKGQFDHGWDRQREKTFARQKQLGVIPANAQLTPRPAEIPAWESFNPQERRAMSRMQEVFAGFLAQTDHEVGRVLDAVHRLGRADNTLVIYIVGDNGGSAEGTPTGTIDEGLALHGIQPRLQDLIDHIDELGGPATAPHYPAGWAWAGSTPFQYFKRVSSHLGSIRNGMVVSWPAHLRAAGEVRAQFHHVVDVLPTVLEAAHISLPQEVEGVQQQSYDGTSFVYSFADATAPSNHRTQYFEIMGTYGIYEDGWFASARRSEQMPWVMTPAADRPLSQDRWQLFDLTSDYSQATGLAAKNPEKLLALQTLFDREAQRNDVYPLMGGARHNTGVRPGGLSGQTHLKFYPGTIRLREGIIPNPLLRSHTITAALGKRRGDGMIITLGGRFGGYALYVQDGHLVYSHNYFGREHQRIRTEQVLPPGALKLRMEFDRTSAPPSTGGRVTLYVGDSVAASGDIPRTSPWRISLDETQDVGEDHGTGVDDSYVLPYRYSGDLQSVEIDLH